MSGNLLKMLGEYESDDKVVCYVTCAGKSNALSAVVDCNSFKPVIACPPLKNETNMTFIHRLVCPRMYVLCYFI